jgi:hypothetical protein
MASQESPEEDLIDDDDDIEVLDDDEEGFFVGEYDVESLDNNGDILDHRDLSLLCDRCIRGCSAADYDDGANDIYAFDLDISRAPPFSACGLDLDGGPAYNSQEYRAARWESAVNKRLVARPVVARLKPFSDAHRPVVVRVTMLSGHTVEAKFDRISTVYQVRRWLAQNDSSSGVRVSQLLLVFGDQIADDKSRLRDLLSTVAVDGALELQLIRQHVAETKSLEKFLNASDSSDAAYL